MILHKKREMYDAFVIVHGTDTMSYTASALSLLLLVRALTSYSISNARTHTNLFKQAAQGMTKCCDDNLCLRLGASLLLFGLGYFQMLQILLRLSYSYD